jgi:hypothetical protein
MRVSCLSVCLSALLYTVHSFSFVVLNGCFYIKISAFSLYVRLWGGKSKFRWLATTGENLPSTHEIMTSLRYAYGILSQNFIDCPASRVKSFIGTNIDTTISMDCDCTDLVWQKDRTLYSNRMPMQCTHLFLWYKSFVLYWNIHHKQIPASHFTGDLLCRRREMKWTSRENKYRLFFTIVLFGARIRCNVKCNEHVSVIAIVMLYDVSKIWYITLIN